MIIKQAADNVDQQTSEIVRVHVHGLLLQQAARLVG